MKSRLTINIDDKLKTKIKMKALKVNKTITDITLKLLNDWLKK